MVDTIRTKANLLTLLADNTAGAINPQVHRDGLLSNMSQMGQIYTHETALETTIALVDTWYELDMTGAILNLVTQVITGTPDFDMPAAGRLRSLCANVRHCHIVGSMSFVGPTNNQEYAFRLGKNGTPSIEADLHRKVGTGADVGAIAIHWVVELAQNDYVSLFVKNVTSNANLQVITSNLQVVSMLM